MTCQHKLKASSDHCTALVVICLLPLQPPASPSTADPAHEKSGGGGDDDGDGLGRAHLVEEAGCQPLLGTEAALAGQLQPLEAAPAEVGLPVGQVRVAGLDRGHAAANHESVFPLRRPIGGQYSPGGAGAGAGLLGGGDLGGLQHRAPPVVGVAGVTGGPHSAAVPQTHNSQYHTITMSFIDKIIL